MHRIGGIIRRYYDANFYCGVECDQKYIDNQEGWSDEMIHSVMILFQVESDEERFH